MKQDKNLNAASAANEEAMPDNEVIEPALAWGDINAKLDVPTDEDGWRSNEEIVDLMIDRQIEAEGAIPTAPCDEAMELIRWWADMPEDWIGIWRDRATRRRLCEAPLQKVNDANLVGTPCPEFEILMAREATFMIGFNFPDNLRKTTKAGQWTAATMTWRAHTEGSPAEARKPAYGLSRHPVDKSKDGACFVFGSSVCGQRKAKAMDTMYAIGIDIDSGAPYDTVLKKILSLGLAAFLYTSWNHRKRGLTLKRDDVLRKLGITNKDLPDGELSVEQVRDYLRTNSKNRYEESFILAVEIAEQAEQTGQGIKIVLQTPPIEKFRVVFPFEEPVSFAELAKREGTQDSALALWEDKITGLAQRHLGVHFDTSCTDPSRLFYTARHAKGSEDWRCDIVQGKPIRFEDIEPMKKSEYLNSRVSGDSNAFIEAGWGQEESPGARFKRYAVTHSERLRLSELVRDLCPEQVVDEKGDLTVVECPHKDGHSDEVDGSGYVKNADGMGSGFGWGCHRDSCQRYDRLDFLAKAVEDGWFPEEALYDEAYLFYEADEDDDPEVIEGEGPSAGNDRDLDMPMPSAKWIRDTYGFEQRGKDIWTAKGKDDDETATVPVCQSFEVVGDAMDDTRSSGAALIVEFKNRTGEKVEMSLPRSEIVSESGGEIIKNLADAGFTFHGRGTHLKNNFLRLLSNITVKRRIAVSPRPGWQRDRLDRVLGFLLPTDEFIRAVPDKTATTKLSPVGAFEDRRARGTLAEWMDAADAAMWSANPENARNANSNFHWTLGLCAAFVGPIIGLADLPPRGLNLSGESSTGKSIALQLGASVWGNPAPRSSAFFPMNNTANAMEDLCTIGSETMLCLDEIGAMNNKRMLSDALFNVALGSGKGRKQGRGAGLAKGARYRPFVMLSNERTLRVEIESAGKRGDYRTGTSVRFPDISVTGAANVSLEVITRLKKANANFGHAGPAFIRYLVKAGIVDDVETLKARVSAAEVEIAKTAVSAGGEIPSGTKRASEVFGLLLVAGELACDAGLIPDRDAVRDAVLEAFRRFMSSGEGEATRGEVSMLEGFRSALISAQGRGALVPAEEAGEVGHTKRIGWYTDVMVILDVEAIKDVTDLGLSGTLDGLLKALDDSGALIRRTKKDRTHDRLPPEVILRNKDAKPRRLRNYRIDREKLEW